MYIEKLGMLSSLGRGSEINAAAMNCGYDGFESEPFGNLGEINVARTYFHDEIVASNKIVEMLFQVIIDATKDIQHSNIGLYICVNQDFQLYNMESELLKLLNDKFDNTFFDTTGSIGFYNGRTSFVSALKKAKTSFKKNEYKHILIASADSRLIPKDLNYYFTQGRLLHKDNSDGFIAGEAATAVLLSREKPFRKNNVFIAGIGLSKETATIMNDEEILRGNGLSKSIMEASNEAHIPIHETAFRVSSVSGEDYFFNETSLAQIKTLKQKVPNHPLWHPADCIGEVGAAIGGAIVIMTYYAFTKKYALGTNALCHISNDDSQRGAFIMQHKSPEQQEPNYGK